MKKYLLYCCLLIISYLFLNINYDVSEVIRVKYLCAPTVRENLVFMFYQLNNLVFVYLSIMDYLLIKKETEIRIGKKGYLLTVSKRCFVTFAIIFSVNVIVDILMFHVNSVIYCLADIVFMISTVLLINILFGKKDYQAMITALIICVIRNICLCMILL